MPSSGHLPEWYPLIRAARYLGVPPWELAKRPLWWTEIAWVAENAENAAAATRSKLNAFLNR